MKFVYEMLHINLYGIVLQHRIVQRSRVCEGKAEAGRPSSFVCFRPQFLEFTLRSEFLN